MANSVEYRDAKPSSNITRLDEAWSMQARATVSLDSYTAGYEPAGSMARWTEAGFAVRWYANGAMHGRRFTDEQSARAFFANITAVLPPPSQRLALNPNGGGA